MKIDELRQLTADEIDARTKQWRQDVFLARLKSQPAESRDTSVVKKLRRTIARALTVRGEKVRIGKAQ